MSNTAVPTRTETAGHGTASAWLVDATRLVLGAGLLTLLLMTFSPFAVSFEGSRDAGDIVNQVGYSALAAVALAGHLMFTGRAVALSLLRPAWLLMAAWLVVSALFALSPQNALRTAAFTILAMIAVTGALSLPRDARSFRICLTIAALAVLGLSYVGIVAMPGVAIHDGGGTEPQHAGLWRGIYSHKNVAGAVMGALFFCGLYLFRSGQRWTGLLIAGLSVLFVLKTGSKTATALLPAVACLVIGLRLFGGRLLPAIAVGGAVAAMALLTLGTVLSPTLDSILQAVLPGTTFTGRTDLWRFALELFQGREWTGFGLNSFWQTNVAYGAERNFELAWDTRSSPNGHNGFLDVALATGWPGLCLAVLVLVLLPLRDYVRIGNAPEDQRLADMFLMILAFLLLNSFLESFLFERANPIWMILWMAVAGLRLLSCHRLQR
ncbi:O-antigen ligase family protein [Aurantimonas endophytica]|uniref:O-antigen ligase n=1 Tax=Aurantimonas endophytica TaxID=1522175 RepID=A0A7W6HD00_9HYPH|nr:O-antigen ligase [Aurantimonas endophytica]MBB4002787.1 O-antigen ligase [Aurantimonas endophytica]MCO6403665.1 O-antigen ligase family protein [Aurantimonas endophytica]